MDFMQQQITNKQRGWLVETGYCGTFAVPGDVVGVPSCLRTDFAIDDWPTRNLLADRLADYVEGSVDASTDSITVVHGYFARMSAPGYMDCTEWTFHKTVREARDHLRDFTVVSP